MDVAIIGTGNVGGALARSLSRAGHAVTISSTSPDEARVIAEEIGGTAASSNREAVHGAEVVIPAVYFDSLAEILDEVGDVLEGKVLVDVTNRMGETPGASVDGTSNAETIQARAPQARVVKAFNTLFASRQADPEVDGTPVDALIAGNDDVAKKMVSELAGSMGMRPIDVGPLDAARNLEALAVLTIWLNMQGGSWQNTWKLLEPS
jgi:NADPH-dependent F420 reductase